MEIAGSGSAAQLTPARANRSMAARVIGKFRQIPINFWRKYVRNRHHIYSSPATSSSVQLPPGLTIQRVDNWDALAPWLNALSARRTARHLEIMRQELSERGVMWLALVDGKLAAYLWSRKARFIPNWFVPLAEEDLQFFAATTFEEFRGRGIAPTLMRYIMQHEMNGRGTAYVDCAQWNKPAARFFEKAGFTRIATMKRYDH